MLVIDNQHNNVLTLQIGIQHPRSTMGKRKGPTVEEKKLEIKAMVYMSLAKDVKKKLMEGVQLNDSTVRADFTPDPGVKAAREAIDRCFLGAGLTEIAHTDDSAPALDIITQRYNIRPLVKDHYKGISDSLIVGLIENMKYPLIAAVKPGQIKNVGDLVKDFTEHSKDVPVVVFKTKTESFVLLSGQHRIQGAKRAVEVLKKKYTDMGVHCEKLRGKRENLRTRVEKDVEQASQGGKSLGKGATRRVEVLEGLDGDIAILEEEMEKIELWVAKIRHWPILFYDLSEQHWFQSRNGTYSPRATEKLEAEGEYPKQLPRLLSENEELKTMQKLVVERIADGVSDMVQWQGKEDRLNKVIANFVSITDNTAKSILTHDALRDTLFYAANVSDAFKYFELFQSSYLTKRVLGKTHDNVSAVFYSSISLKR